MGSYLLKREHTIIDCNFNIPANGITGLFGPSGAGKTSLLRCIAGLERPSKGQLFINDLCWQDSHAGIFIPTHKRQLSYVFQDPHLFTHFSVKKNLMYGYRRNKNNKRYIKIEDVINWMCLEALLDRNIHSLSGGEKQRVAIARALLCNPMLLLMDEPVSALDLDSKNEVLSCLENLQQDVSIPILYVTHSQQELAQLADHILLMDDGEIHASAPAEEILTQLSSASVKNNAPSIVMAKLVKQDPTYPLSYLSFAGGDIAIPLIKNTIGDTVSLKVYAKDVTLFLAKPPRSSVLNTYQASIASIEKESDRVQLNLNGILLNAFVTRKAIDALNLHQGMKIYVQIKFTSI